MAVHPPAKELVKHDLFLRNPKQLQFLVEKMIGENAASRERHHWSTGTDALRVCFYVLVVK